MFAYMVQKTGAMFPKWILFTFFMILVLIIYGLAHYYVYRRVVASLGIKGEQSGIILKYVFIFMMVSFPFSRLFVRTIGINPFTYTLDWLSSVWMGFIFYVFLFALIFQILLIIPTLLDFSFIPILRKVSIWMAIASGLAMTIAALYEARLMMKTTVLELPVKNLPPEREGFRIVQLSDTHVGVLVSEPVMKRTIDAVNSLDADLVVITGDLVDEDAAHLNGISKLLNTIKSRNGVYAVTGNHEFYSGVEEAIAWANKGNVTYIRNGKRTIAGFLDIYGVDDPTAAQFGEPRVLPEEFIGLEARTRPSILLYHQPRGMEKAAEKGIDIILSGHTHNGQIWPVSLISRMIYPHENGLYKIGETALYVSRGIGTWGPPMRLGSPPEVVLVKLKNKSG